MSVTFTLHSLNEQHRIATEIDVSWLYVNIGHEIYRYFFCLSGMIFFPLKILIEILII